MTEPNEDTMITINVNMSVALPADAVWPDGVPEGWTTYDVLNILQDYSSLQSWAQDWCLTEGADATVSAPGHPSATGMVW